MSDLSSVWVQQSLYNQRVKLRQERSEPEWMETYILGLISECGQLLEAMRWKKNRLESIEEFGPNVPEELADVTKFVFSMWILLGYTPEDMLEEVYAKGILLEQIFQQEFENKLQPKVVIFDLDNVLADLQSALAIYMNHCGFDMRSLQANIHLDLAVNQRFDEYRTLKNQFEKTGGYRILEPLYPLEFLFSSLRQAGYSLVVYTARPVEIFKRIRGDTLFWLQKHNALPDRLLFGREDRILFASRLLEQGHQVVLVEDDPGLIKRALLCHIPTIVPYRDYNRKFSNFNGTAENLVAVISTMEGTQDDGREIGF
jgi:NTP pyrophosphatase (non-canonical NTP hydrolase)